MLTCNYDKLVYKNEFLTYEYQNNILTIYDNETNNTYKVKTNNEYEEILNKLINEWIAMEEILTTEHLEFLTKIRENLDIQRYVENGFDYLTIALMEQ